ncbi:V/A-type H+/Na+-transporting ATPase subunit I [termite gut metagenome]|uniref:V/A-type H+/Na+-transporting ATPase subunit I n=2 Tax=termite gut metagenome TaxID=433724 RepID=A0A5J4QMC5_9ZZZZ
MISKMKKVTFLVYHKEYETFLNDIRDLGVVHVVERQKGTPESSELQEHIQLSTRLAGAVKLLRELQTEAKVEEENATSESGLRVLDEMDTLLNEKSRLAQQLQVYAKDRKALEPWGNFEPESIQKLQEGGLRVSFYSCSENSYKADWEQEHHAIIINRLSSKVYFITLTKLSDMMELDAEYMKLPAYSLSQVVGLYEDTEKAIEAVNQKLSGLAAKDIPALQAALRELHNDIEFSNVLLNTEQTAGDKLMLLQGWAPASKELEIAAYLHTRDIYYEVTPPTPGDNVPIQFNNKGFFVWFEPISKLYMLPKYNELDLTPFFAPFFMLFFGLCLGDSGYGLFLFLAVTIYRMKAKHIGATLKPILSLVQVLMVSTFFCGLLTGSCFGFNLYDINVPFLQRMKESIVLDNNQMFRLSLILGGIQIIFGMCLKVVNQTIQLGFKYAIGTIGWILLLVSTIVSVLVPAIGLGSTIHLVLLSIAGLMIFLYNSPDKNIFVNIGLGLWDSYGMVTGLMGDVLSYVRLFALGLSGGILASVFNSLAKGMSPDNAIAGPIVMVLIFLIGHSINMFMNVLGAMVHPMRLTFVEFFKSAGYEGGSKAYKPFAKY